MNVFEMDAKNFDDFDGFIAEFNRVFISGVGGQWDGNLDAPHDYFGWARGTVRDSLAHPAATSVMMP